MYADVKGYWKRRKSMAMMDLETTATKVYDADRVFSITRHDVPVSLVMLRNGKQVHPKELADKINFYNGDVIVHKYFQYL